MAQSPVTRWSHWTNTGKWWLKMVRVRHPRLISFFNFCSTEASLKVTSTEFSQMWEKIVVFVLITFHFLGVTLFLSHRATWNKKRYCSHLAGVAIYCTVHPWRTVAMETFGVKGVPHVRMTTGTGAFCWVV